MDLNQFIAWQAEDKNRTVTIKIGETPRTHDIEIFAYDYNLAVGQHVKSVDEIDLDGIKEREEKAEFERLRKKFEDKKSD